MRVAIAHEWLVRYAGSERVVEQMRLAFPGSSLHSTLVQTEDLPPGLRDSDSSFLQRIPGAADHHEWLLPLMPLAWRTKPPLADVDVVVSSSHACVRSVRIAEGVPHLCYCHAPMRYAWDFEAERERFPAPIRPAAKALMALARPWDRRTAQRVTAFVANSSAVANRIQRFYDRSAQVVHPPVDTEFFTRDASIERDGFLYVGRLVGYKRADLVVEAFRDLPFRLTVIGEGHLGPELRACAPDNVRFLGSVDAKTLRAHYRAAEALVFPADEDFGIAMAEAQACGTPVISLRAGGAMDIVAAGETGLLIDEPTAEAVRAAVHRVHAEPFDSELVSLSAQRFGHTRFQSEIRQAALSVVEGGGTGNAKSPPA